MSQSVPHGTKSFIAGADLSTKQYLIVKVSAANTVTVATAASDAIVGALQNEPKATEGAELVTCGTAKVICGASVNIGDDLTADSGSKAIATTTGNDNAIGFALEAGDANDVIEYWVSLHNV